MLKIVKHSNLISKFQNINVLVHSIRSISVSTVLNLKRIEKTEDKAKKNIVIEGKYINPEEKFKAKVLNLNDTDNQDSGEVRPCAFCELEKKDIFVQYTDVLVLRQFLTEEGQVLPRKVTGLCKKQQRKLLVLTKLAKQAGLILNLQPSFLDGTKPSADPSQRINHMKWNAYYDDYETMLRTKKYL